MKLSKTTRFYLNSFLKHDFKASITVFFVALPLCLGISLASGAPLYSGLIAGLIGGIVVSLISGSHLSVSGPAAGLTAICATAITDLGAIEIFFLAVAIAGVLQIILGVFRLGGFTHFIPSAVIKGMLTAIGILLIIKQIPLLIGYNEPEFWSKELFNIIWLNNAFSNMDDIYRHISIGAILIAIISLVLVFVWRSTLGKRLANLPTAFVTVLLGSLLAILFDYLFPSIALKPLQYVNIPARLWDDIQYPDFKASFNNPGIWKTAILICFVASLESLLSIEAIDKIDPYNRITPQNRELIAQGTGNLFSGLLGGIPITAVIVRSSANAEAGAKTKVSSFMHGIWLLLALLVAIPLVNKIPYSVLAVILIRTGYNLAKPKMMYAVYKQGKEQFFPYLVTVIAILFTDLLIGVIIGITYSIYFLIKHTYRAGYTIKEIKIGDIRHFRIELALNVSFLNKKRILEMLDKIPEDSSVEIDGSDSIYIDNDILEIFHDFKAKAYHKHIELVMKDIPEVETIELH